MRRSFVVPAAPGCCSKHVRDGPTDGRKWQQPSWPGNSMPCSLAPDFTNCLVPSAGPGQEQSQDCDHGSQLQAAMEVNYAQTDTAIHSPDRADQKRKHREAHRKDQTKYS